MPDNEVFPVSDYRVLPNSIRLIDTREDVDEKLKSRVLTKYDVINIANESGLDLLCIDDTGNPPVYKLLDYGKFKFEQQKKQREIAKKNRFNARTVKEYNFTPGMTDHDFETRMRQLEESLTNHDIKISVKFNGKAKSQLGMRYIDISDMYKLSRDQEFILNRVLLKLGERVVTPRFSVGDKQISAILKPL